MLGSCLPNVFDAGSTRTQHWINVSSLLGHHWQSLSDKLTNVYLRHKTGIKLRPVAIIEITEAAFQAACALHVFVDLIILVVVIRVVGQLVSGVV